MSVPLDKQGLRNRLRSAQGHMRAIAEMIDGEGNCIDILRQVSAVRGAIRAIHRELWQAYLLDEECRLRSDDERQRVNAWRELEALIVGYPDPQTNLRDQPVQHARQSLVCEDLGRTMGSSAR